MRLEIEPLSPERAADYFDFFENRAFTDDSPWRCYCQMFQMTAAEASAAFANAADAGAVSREEARRQIERGALRGYLAYADGVSVGWCNCNDRANYPADSANGPRFHAPADMREKAVVCFEIAPEFRGKGVATALLRRALDDARSEGYRAVAAYPEKREERYEWDYAGPLRLYQKLGFLAAGEGEGYIVMRREFGA